MFLPAISGADPWQGSNSELSSPSDALASRPSEPASTDASSERMSPKVFSVRMTSNWPGFMTSCIAQLSTSISVRSTCGYSTATRCTILRHKRPVSRTFALSTLVTLPRRLPAAAKARCAMRSISYSSERMTSWACAPALPFAPAPAAFSTVTCSPKYKPPVSSRTMRISQPRTVAGLSGEASRSAS